MIKLEDFNVIGIEFEFSIDDGSIFGMSKNGKVTIFLKKIAELYDPERCFDSFISYISAVEIHELGHTIGYIQCGHYYRMLTHLIGSYLRDEKWDKKYSQQLKKIVNDLDIAKEEAIIHNEHICKYCINDNGCDLSLVYEMEFQAFVRNCNDFEALKKRIKNNKKSEYGRIRKFNERHKIDKRC